MHTVDHEGNKFFSIKDMCEYWGIECQLFQQRIRAGWELNDALTKPKCQTNQRAAKPCTDHLGNTFSSISELCRHYGIPRTTLKSRQKKGYTLEECLCPEKINESRYKVVDHMGNRFKSLRKMVQYWNLSLPAFQHRIESGWSLKDALETPVYTRHALAKVCKDHLGNEYPSKLAMCRHYGISVSKFRSRVKRGVSLEIALTTRGDMRRGRKPST